MLTTSKPRATKYYLIQYNDNTFRLLKNKYQLEKGWELCAKYESILQLEKFIKSLYFDKNTEEIERISLTRTKSRIRELALCNNFEYFGTITINNYFCNRYELTECQNKLKKILKKIKRNNNEFKYLIITEKHKDNAFHFHGLFSGIDLSLNENGYFYNQLFQDELGYNSFSLIKDYNKCCNYITKYITKDCVKNSHNQLFIRSKGLTVATKEEIEPLEPNWKFENDFCSIYDFNLDNITEEEKNILMHLITCK